MMDRRREMYGQTLLIIFSMCMVFCCCKIVVEELIITHILVQENYFKIFIYILLKCYVELSLANNRRIVVGLHNWFGRC